jgi:hypothetical protein
MLPLLELDSPCDEAVARAKCALEDNGLRVIMSFDSQLTRRSASSVPCPHHGITCDCQLVVLLVYDKDNQPATLLAQGQDGST